jgi:hypothetical protein
MPSPWPSHPLLPAAHAARAAALLVTLAVVGPDTARAQAKAPEHVRGTVVSLVGDELEVQVKPGQVVKLELAGDATVALVDKADLASVAEGTFIGTTAVPEAGGKLRAVEVHLFPESMRGVGEGHRPWDLRPGSSMTNATVAGVSAVKGPSSMTNATVAKVSGSGTARTLRLQYQGGEQVVDVPPNTPVVKLEPGDRSALVPGAHVFVIAARSADGKLVAQRISAGRNGVVPPM